MIDNGIYDEHMLDNWSREDVDELASYIKHERDNMFTYSGLQQLIDKYLIKNRTTGIIYETPQVAYMCIAMCLFSGDKKRVKEAYDSYSTFKVNLLLQ